LLAVLLGQQSWLTGATSWPAAVLDWQLLVSEILSRIPHPANRSHSHHPIIPSRPPTHAHH